jgi:threonine dehydrogenase-like Zn-dependent dehydrogenase
VVTDDALFNGQYVRGNIFMFDGDAVPERETEQEENGRNDYYLKPGDKVTIEMSAVSQGYLDFIRQCRREKNGENPMFGGPASNIVTNISNGGVGYFSGYIIMRETVFFIPPE